MKQHLHVFVTVAEKESFSRAAEEHYMTQPAVSQYVRALEEAVGTKLLERNNKYVRLNKAGEIVYHHATEILGLYTNMQTLVDDLANKANGPLTIGASYTFGEYVLPHLLAILQERYPHIEPTVIIENSEKIASLVATNQLDIGIVEGKVTNSALHIEPFATDEMMLVGGKDCSLAKQTSVKIKHLAMEQWIVREMGSGTRDMTEALYQTLGFTPNKLISFSSTQPIKESVEAGLGISLLSKWTIEKELQSGDLRVIPVEGLPLSREFSILTKSMFQTKALQVFIDLLHCNEIV